MTAKKQEPVTDAVIVKTEIGIDENQWDIIGKKTNPEYIKKRVGRGGYQLSYVEAGYIIEVLNKVFRGMWDFEVVEQGVGKTQIWVRGKLTVKIPTPFGMETITKTQYGGADVKYVKGTETVVDLADDLKAAASDCLKKCASLFGIASDVYSKTDYNLDTSVEAHTSSSTPPSPSPVETPDVPLITPDQIKKLHTVLSEYASLSGQVADELKRKMKTRYKLESTRDMPKALAMKLIDFFEGKINELQPDDIPF